MVILKMSTATNDTLIGKFRNFFTANTAVQFESVVIINPNAHFCVDNAFCEIIKRAFGHKPIGTYGYEAVLRDQNISFQGALVALFEFENLTASEP